MTNHPLNDNIILLSWSNRTYSHLEVLEYYSCSKSLIFRRDFSQSLIKFGRCVLRVIDLLITNGERENQEMKEEN